MAPEFKNSGATFSTTLRMFKECKCFETRVEDGLSDSRKAGCRRSGGSLHKSRAWQKTYAPARTQSAVLFCTSVSLDSTFLCLAEDLCTSQDAVSGTFHSTVLRFVKKTVPRAGPEMYFS